MNNLLMSTFSSMNYLFLKTIVNQVDDDLVNIELQNYLICLNLALNESNVSQINELKEIVEKEMVDGDYFYDYNNNIQIIKALMQQNIVMLSETSLDNVQSVHDFYINCVENVLHDNKKEQYQYVE